MRIAPFAGLLLAVLLPARAGAEAFHLLAPVRDASGNALMQAAPDGRTVPVATAYHGPLEARLRAVLATGAPALLPALDRQARAASRQPVDCPALGEAGIAIYLSDEDGGFARDGLYVETAPGRRAWCADRYIDITVDPDSLEDGTFEEVLAHEYGHVLLRRLLGPVPATPSRQMHSVLTVTDPVTAFDEGFGIQMQPLAARLAATPGFRARVEGRAPPSAADLWLSRRETALRETAVPRNAFVFAPVVPEGDGDAHARWLAAETGWLRDPCRLQPANAMLASEGVAAAFLYRLLDTGDDAQAVAARYARLVDVLARLGRWPQDAPLVALVRAWGAAYPDDREAVTRLFLDATYGATASRELHAAAERLSCLGARGDLPAFVPALKAYRATLAALATRVLAGEGALDAALGPALWLADPAVRIPSQPWSPERDQPLVVDLNTAGEPALALLLGDRALAGRLVAARGQGAYAGLDDAARRAGLDAAQAARLRRLAAAARQLPPFVRE